MYLTKEHDVCDPITDKQYFNWETENGYPTDESLIEIKKGDGTWDDRGPRSHISNP